MAWESVGRAGGSFEAAIIATSYVREEREEGRRGRFEAPASTVHTVLEESLWTTQGDISRQGAYTYGILYFARAKPTSRKTFLEVCIRE